MYTCKCYVINPLLSKIKPIYRVPWIHHIADQRLRYIYADKHGIYPCFVSLFTYYEPYRYHIHTTYISFVKIKLYNKYVNGRFDISTFRDKIWNMIIDSPDLMKKLQDEYDMHW